MSRVQHLVIYHEFEQFMVKLLSEFNSKPPASVEEHLKVLCSEMNKLLATWSIMAGRNILNDMTRTAQALELALTGPAQSANAAKSAAKALKERMTRHLGQYSVANARYDSVLCLGYKVQTTGALYEGMSDDYEDLKHKCQEMIEAIQAAYKLVSPPEKADQRMLKIFMAPEFFFRGRNGGYDYDDVLGLAAGEKQKVKPGLLDMMREEIGKPIYKDWLFVLGTVVALSRSGEHCCKVCNERAEEQLVGDKRKFVCTRNSKHIGAFAVASAENVAYVCKESEVYTVTKELISNIDYRGIELSKKKSMQAQFKHTVRMGKEVLEVLKVGRYGLPNGQAAASDRPSKFQDERMGGCIFTMDGITFGLEVCLDHMSSATETHRGRLNHAANIQIQLIPSAGSTIRQFRTVPNGIVFNADGGLDAHLQVVGKRGNHILGFEHIDYRGDSKFTIRKKWRPEIMAEIMDLNSEEHSRSWKAWRGTSSARRASAPRGIVGCYGPFEIPQTWT